MRYLGNDRRVRATGTTAFMWVTASWLLLGAPVAWAAWLPGMGPPPLDGSQAERDRRALHEWARAAKAKEEARPPAGSKESAPTAPGDKSEPVAKEPPAAK